MENYYTLLGVNKNASYGDIKRAFRERAKVLHPDIAGKNAEARMRRILTAYQILSSPDRRFEYDRAYERFIGSKGFDYRNFLKDRVEDPPSQARLVFFLLLHLEDEEALEVWDKNGGLDFSLEKYLDREDWMDCAFLLAEELDKRRRPYEAFMLLLGITREERRRPYFKHFMEDVEKLLKELVRLRLKSAVDGETYLECLESLFGLGFSSKDERRWAAAMAGTLHRLGKGPAPGRLISRNSFAKGS
ncbi:MAG: J domain-containing protein [Spirochaetaceae bacterium]|jgi:curved DNA-binding protein CbpA|nr:J domain-containing protein [Spirochaetaceae bacterium]